MKKFFLPLVLFGLITFNCFSQSGVKWSADGNSPSSNDFFGTNNVFPIVFKTAAIERMRLSESGNFGIGVINPTHKFEVGGNSLFTGDLEVTGTINFTSTQTANIVAPMIKTSRITALDGDTLIHIGDSSFVFFTQVGLPDRMWSNKMNFGLGIGLASWGRGRGSVAIGRYVDAYGEYSYTMGTLLSTSTNAARSVVIGSGFDNSNTTRLINDIPNSLMIGFNSTVPTLFVSPALGPANNTTGKVGIGTTITCLGTGATSPCTKVNIESEAEEIGLFVHKNYNSLIPDENNYGIVSSSNSENTKGLVVGNMDFHGRGAEYFVVYNNGKTIIGSSATTIADYKLSVEGLIVAKEVKISLTGFPDYVFDPKYKLPKLSDVEKYINKNKHLPDVPSAAEVEENGLALGEMNKVLLKKVEELTLYMITLQKENEALKDRMTKLEKK